MGKYDKVAKTLPVATPKGGVFRDDVNSAKRVFTDRSPAALAAAFRAFKGKKAELESQVSRLTIRITAAEELMWDAFESEDRKQFYFDDGGSVSVNPDITIAVEDPDVLNKWVEENDLGRLRKLHSSTVGSIVKERLLAGLELPPGVRVGTWKKTSLHQGKK